MYESRNRDGKLHSRRNDLELVRAAEETLSECACLFRSPLTGAKQHGTSEGPNEMSAILLFYVGLLFLALLGPARLVVVLISSFSVRCR